MFVNVVDADKQVKDYLLYDTPQDAAKRNKIALCASKTNGNKFVKDPVNGGYMTDIDGDIIIDNN